MAVSLTEYLANLETRDPRLKEFAAVLFEKADPERFGGQGAEWLTAFASSGLRFLESLGDDALKVAVFEPTAAINGWDSPHAVLMLALRDRPFIVDSVQAELRRQRQVLVGQLHPTLLVSRDQAGSITEFGAANGRREAFEVFFLARPDDPAALPAVAEGVRRVLTDVILATDDYGAMLDRAGRTADHLRNLVVPSGSAVEGVTQEEMRESAEFLDWLRDGNFVFLGYREYAVVSLTGRPALKVVEGSGLGVLSKESGSSFREPVPLEELPPDLSARVTGGRLFLVTKANAESTVHRPRRMDYVGIKELDAHGGVAGERRFVGLFTSKGLATPVGDVPILRRKLKQVLEREQALRGSHDYKAIVAAFDGMPREELFWMDAEQIHANVRTILGLPADGPARLTLHEDPLGRGVAAMVVMPHASFSDEVRRSVQRFLAGALGAQRVDYRVALGQDEEHARFHFFFSTSTRLSAVDVTALERQIQYLARSWQEELREQLATARGSAIGQRLSERYVQAFDERYRSNVTPGQAVTDIANFESLADVARVVDLQAAQPGATDGTQALLRVYHHGHGLALSDVLPVLENVGLRVIEQYPYAITVNGAQYGVDVYTVANAAGGELVVANDRARLVEALDLLFAGVVENDQLNRLVLHAGLSVREVALLRAYQMYYAQVNAATSRSFVTAALLTHPDVAAKLVRYFEARFDPAQGTDAHDPGRRAREAAAKQAAVESLGAVASLAEDGALRGVLDLMAATVRTNYYLGLDRISFKLDSAKVASMPEPRPLFEIAVSGPHVEGTHLRGGKVARGGIRWSDRPDDFRTEVLGLLKTQTTKNAVIVPVGSKGGFVIKGAPAGREQMREFVREQYRTYIRALLDLTDNLKDGRTVAPTGLVIYDEPDPYLVVAADKGTATFSDLANATAAEYDFWLGDAFASGGSAGYDHKGMGITARGAWEAVKRHFAELGVDVHHDTFTVCGIGDMSGDVFGNGMLYTDRIRLQAAFNHLHVFLDPDPDPRASYDERRRLFELPRSTWADYDPTKLSRGGGIYERSAKSIRLTDEVREMLGVEATELSGQDLIKAVLRMDVDLLYNGGIGTYVKSSTERNAEVGDSANDGVRVDGAELRATVVGEGGNLGFTQLGRIEYALGGGRIDTDAIDNSAGVDTSDHEVNIKILFQPLVASGELTLEARDELLRSMTEDVAGLVLGHNRSQALALSLGQRASRDDLPLFSSLLDYLVGSAGLNPHVENLPTARQLEERRRAGLGLTRPELAVMLAYVKMGLYRRLLETDLLEEPRLRHYLNDYFPSVLNERFPHAIGAHRLHREITATVMTNTLVDQLGIAFVHKAMRNSGVTPVEVIRATLTALELLGAKELRRELDVRAAELPAESYYAAIDQLVTAVEGLVAWLLFNDAGHGRLDDIVATYAKPLEELRGSLTDYLPEGEGARFEAAMADAEELGFERDEAERMASLGYLVDSAGIVDVASAAGAPLEYVAERYYQLGERLRLGWLRDSIEALASPGLWEQVALVGLVMDVRSVQRGLTAAYLAAAPDESDGMEAALDAFLGTAGSFKRYELALSQLQEPGTLDLAAGSVLVRILEQARGTAHGGD